MRGEAVVGQGEDMEATQSGKCDDNPAYELHWTTSGSKVSPTHEHLQDLIIAGTLIRKGRKKKKTQPHVFTVFIKTQLAFHSN